MTGFEEIIGHEQIIEHLKNSITMDKVSHAYILNGPDKSGKMMLAEAYAMALQCEKQQGEPCMECHSCHQALSHSQPDIIYVPPRKFRETENAAETDDSESDGKAAKKSGSTAKAARKPKNAAKRSDSEEKPAKISVEDVRKLINGDVAIKPYSSRYKVYIVDNADSMNAASQNALLKTLEEPPEYVVILLLTVNADQLLPTILSRCVRLNLKPVRDDVIRELLMKQYKLTDYQADICVAFAQGSVGKAIQLATSQDFNELKAAVLQLVKRLSDIDFYEMGAAVKQIREYKLEINDYFDLMMIWFRDVLYLKATNDVNGLIFKDEAYEIKKQAERRSYHGIEDILEALEKAKTRLNANVNFELVIELLLLTIKEN